MLLAVGEVTHTVGPLFILKLGSNPKTSDELTYTKQPQHLTGYIILEELPSLALSFLTC